jgi:pyruvate formate lyase activating enzyme
MKEAMFYKRLADNTVRCDLCAHRCVIEDGEKGFCGVRENRSGTLYSLVYGRAIAMHVDPIEKKPLFHYQPGSYSLSVATVGCNFRCRHCQNADLSIRPIEDHHVAGQNVPPEELVAAAQRSDCASVAYTYTEPTIFFEYALDTARLASREGLGNVFVTNGYMTDEALRTIAPVLDAANVDLKAFSEQHYEHICEARLAPVLDTLRLMKRLGIWLEVTTLLIPTVNDSDTELRQIAEFIIDLGPEVPWHISRFYPTFRMNDLPPTPAESIQRGRQIGLEAGLKYVYSGNLPGDDGESTFCPQCGQRVIHRQGYEILESRLQEGRCNQCQTVIDGMGLEAVQSETGQHNEEESFKNRREE